MAAERPKSIHPPAGPSTSMNIKDIGLIAAVAAGAAYLGSVEVRLIGMDGILPEIAETREEAINEINAAEEASVERINDAMDALNAAEKASVERVANAIRQFDPTTTEYGWRQGSGEVRMMPENEGICSLSSVTGKFEGGGEGVYVFTRDGFWYLSGWSQQVEVAASARCWKVPRI